MLQIMQLQGTTLTSGYIPLQILRVAVSELSQLIFFRIESESIVFNFSGASPQIDSFSGVDESTPFSPLNPPTSQHIPQQTYRHRGQRNSTPSGRLSPHPTTQTPTEVDLNAIIKLMQERQKTDDQVNEILKDWKMLAQKLDYFLFWVFLIVTSFTSLLFIFILPYHNRGKLL